MAKELEPYFIIVAGPNGAGKSTFCSQVLFPLWKGKFGKKLSILNPDVVADSIMRVNPEISEIQAYIKAAIAVEQAIPKYLKLKRSFAVETVLSTQKYLKYWNQASDLGFNTVLIYIALPSPEEAINRVQRRVERGGHDVPEGKIKKRFWRSLENFSVFARKSKGFLVYENKRDEGFFVIAGGTGNKLKRIAETKLPIEKVFSQMEPYQDEKVPALLEDYCDFFPFVDFSPEI